MLIVIVKEIPSSVTADLCCRVHWEALLYVFNGWTVSVVALPEPNEPLEQRQENHFLFQLSRLISVCVSTYDLNAKPLKAN